MLEGSKPTGTNEPGSVFKLYASRHEKINAPASLLNAKCPGSTEGSPPADVELLPPTYARYSESSSFTTAVGNMQFEVCVTNGLTTIQPGWPAVRSIRSIACEPLARPLFSYPPAKLKRNPCIGSHVPSISAPFTFALKFRLTEVRSTIWEI